MYIKYSRKHLRYRTLQQWIAAKSRKLLLQSASSYLFAEVLNSSLNATLYFSAFRYSEFSKAINTAGKNNAFYHRRL